MQRLQSTLETNFDTDIVVNLNWGVKDLDRSNVGSWEPSEMGEIIWDDDFTVVPAENQQALLDLCDDLLSDNNTLVSAKQVTCWVKDFDYFVK